MYIRTKDGRIIDTTKIATGSKYMDFATNDESFREIFKTEPLSKSENIEELCDEFVIDNWKEKGKPVYCFKYVKETNSAYCIDETGYLILYLPQMLECGCIIKGAIYTDKGLIYVAKMNDKGELELI